MPIVLRRILEKVGSLVVSHVKGSQKGKPSKGVKGKFEKGKGKKGKKGKSLGKKGQAERARN